MKDLKSKEMLICSAFKQANGKKIASVIVCSNFPFVKDVEVDENFNVGDVLVGDVINYEIVLHPNQKPQTENEKMNNIFMIAKDFGKRFSQQIEDPLAEPNFLKRLDNIFYNLASALIIKNFMLLYKKCK